MKSERKTLVSKAVKSLIKTTKSPISASDIMYTLNSQDLHPNKSTVYRILEKLKEKGEISEIKSEDGVGYYEKKKHEHHHHHFFCKKCKKAFCLKNCHVDVHNINLDALLPDQGFEIDSHQFNLQGTCKDCKSN